MALQRMSGFTTEGGAPISGDIQAGDVVRNSAGDEFRYYPAPPQPVAVLKWDALDFIRRFTRNERIAIRAAAKVDSSVEDFLDLLDKAAATGTLVHANDPDVIAGLEAFEDAELIGEGRAAEILGS